MFLAVPRRPYYGSASILEWATLPRQVSSAKDFTTSYTLEPSLLSASSFGVGKFGSSLSLQHLEPSFLQVTVRQSRCKPYIIFVFIGVSLWRVCIDMCVLDLASVGHVGLHCPIRPPVE